MIDLNHVDDVVISIVTGRYYDLLKLVVWGEVLMSLADHIDDALSDT